MEFNYLHISPGELNGFEKLAFFLNQVSCLFSPTLAAQIPLDDYACKLSGKAHLFVAVCNDIWVGMAAVYINENRMSYLPVIAVLPSFQRKGIASSLLRIAKSQICNLKSTGVTCRVSVDNIAAIKIYEANCFVIEDGEFEVINVRKKYMSYHCGGKN